VVFLHAATRHEAGRWLIARRHPGIAVTTSHEVAPEIREYEGVHHRGERLHRRSPRSTWP
jgi:hypothetical protein